jgi:ABC-type arginine transport system permease subunit
MNFKLILFIINEFTACVAIIGFIFGAYMGENFRAAFQSGAGLN